MARRRRSPYLVDGGRLGDVIAAIQAMGTYKFYRLSFKRWAERISGDPLRAAHWRRVFEDHPEFFRLSTDRQHAALVWRRQYAKRYQVDDGRRLSREEYSRLTPPQRKRVSRDVLKADDIQALISSAISLHSQALEHEKAGRWWVALVTGLAGAVGGFIGAVLGK